MNARASRRHARRPRRQAGTALLSVLLMAALMGVLAIAMLDDIRFGVRRTANADAIAQAQRFALGVEQLARQRAGTLADADPALWNGKPLLFPVEGGLVQANLRDASGCFNLNSVVEGATGQWRRRELGVRQYTALLAAIGVPAARAQALADALVDWIDSDPVRSPLGAEDATYSASSPRYLTAGTLLAEPSELRAIHGYDPALYAQLRPLVCALPDAVLSPVNVNALPGERAAVLSMLTLGELTPAQARAILAARPAGGWQTATAFWAQPALARAMLPNEVYDQVALHSRWFGVQARVDYAGAQVVLEALIESNGGQRSRLVARRWGTEE